MSEGEDISSTPLNPLGPISVNQSKKLHGDTKTKKALFNAIINRIMQPKIKPTKEL